jgi:SHS2 domain-containing protein
MACDTTNTTSTGKPCALSKQRQGVPGIKSSFYEEIEHTADLALRLGGPDLESFFCIAARGMYHLLGAETTPSKGAEQHTISLEAMDLESLLVDWLGELAYLAETAGLVFGEIRFKILTTTRIEAILTGCRMHRLEKVIKAVTYHNLNVVKTGDGYAATVVFDV